MHEQKDSRPSLPAVTLLLVGALLGTSLVAYATAVWGPATFQQAFHHFTAAEALRHGESMTLSRGDPYSIWPPLMPILLAIVRSLGLEYPSAGLLLNLLAHATLLFLSSMLLLRLFGSIRIAVANLVVLLVSPSLLNSATMLHTEPVFIALATAGVYVFVLYLERPTRTRLAAVITLAALACLQRYMGVALVLSVFLLLLAYPESLAPGQRRIRALGFAVLALLPLCLWGLRCLAVGARAGGGTGPPSPLGENAAATAVSLVHFVTPGTSLEEPLGILNTAVALAALALVLVRRARSREPDERRALLVYLAFPVLYVPLFVAIASIVSIDPVSDRFLLPVLPFLWGPMLLGFAWLMQRLRGQRAWLRYAAGTTAGVVFVTHLFAAALTTRAAIARDRTLGTGGMSTPAWAGSPLFAWLHENPPTGAVYSNIPEFALLATGRRATYADAESLPRFLEHAPAGTLVIWMQRIPTALPFPESALGGRRCSLVVRFDRDAVYRLEPDG